jgi:hypothetical protein
MARFRLTRRGALSLVVAGSLAGCTTEDAGSTDSTDSADATDPADASDSPASDTGERSDQGTSSVTDGPSDATETDQLDLREANVVGVELSSSGGGYRFDVTLHHDDDGEDGYANWWQVETLDGERLGRRELAHPHSSDPFTRSTTVEVPEGTTCVVVRGHDQTHGYGGQAMLVRLETGATTPVRQGPERASMAERTC